MRRFALPVSLIVGVAAIVALLFYGVGSTEPDTGIETALASGERPAAPPVTLPALDGGGESSLADYRGEVVVLNYWASWCEPCREESPLLDRWHTKIAKDGRGTVLGVDVLDVSGDARDFMREYGLDYPMLRDGEGEVLGRYGVAAYPETFVIDPKGRIVASRRGPVDEKFMREEVQPLIEEPA